ncbi:MAG: tRNA guanosine(15) transglycosylase TgtA [Candidatus Thermoplasmatota archaeon]|nr:tRNA guanosine(15) transglycosylase TgtA [Candidatus Thermoplasmatota archaeon]
MGENDERKSSTFEIKEVDLAGRSGELTVNGRKVSTPELMPVVNPNMFLQGQAVSPGELMDTFGFKMIITNSYIIRNTPGLLEMIEGKGLHDFFDFPGIVMTDSGTFQSYIYSNGGEVDVDPLEIVRFQDRIGSDIGTILDRFTVPDRDHQGASEDLDTTLERARGSIDLGSNISLAVPVQGGRHIDLRERSGRSVRELGVEYAPIGGVVPIMESYDYKLLVDVIASAKIGLGPSIPAHLFGAGHPMVLPLAVALGCDLFDSASYAKFAKDDRYMTQYRTFHLKEMDTLPCNCPVCSRSDPSDLLELPGEERYMALSRHNLWMIRSTLDIIRSAIREGTLWEVVERSAMHNPRMYSAVRRLKDHSGYLEENSPRTTRRFSCCSGLSLARPEFKRYEHALMTSFSPPENDRAVILEDWTMTRSRKVVSSFDDMKEPGLFPLVRSPLGPIPYSLIDMYPLSQSILPEPGSLDRELQEHMMSVEMKFLEKNNIRTVGWNGSDTIRISKQHVNRDVRDMERIIGIIDMQIPGENGIRPSDLIMPEKKMIGIKRSRRTGKIRNIMEKRKEGDVHLLSLRAEDGHLNLKAEAARRLHHGTNSSFFRVVVETETAEYNARGYNVFCKFVNDADRRIRPGDEVLIVDGSDELHAVGVAAVPWRMMLEGRSGIAVKVREGARDD